jgi:putative ABC transport system permease protein
VVVVSRPLADRLWPHEEPIGQRLQFADTTHPEVWFTVVGVSGPVLHHNLDARPGLEMYLPWTQSSTNGPYYVIRTTVDPNTVAGAATALVGQTDPNQSFLDVQAFEQRILNRMWQRRLAGTLLSVFAAIALVLAAVGLYSVLSYLVAQQTREIGVRMAIGARPADILTLIVGRGMRLVVVGAIAGGALALGLARLVAHLLFEVSPGDVATFSAVTIALLVISALACYIPARRATRIDPVVALRSE